MSQLKWYGGGWLQSWDIYATRTRCGRFPWNHQKCRTNGAVLFCSPLGDHRFASISNSLHPETGVSELPVGAFTASFLFSFSFIRFFLFCLLIRCRHNSHLLPCRVGEGRLIFGCWPLEAAASSCYCCPFSGHLGTLMAWAIVCAAPAWDTR